LRAIIQKLLHAGREERHRALNAGPQPRCSTRDVTCDRAIAYLEILCAKAVAAASTYVTIGRAKKEATIYTDSCGPLGRLLVCAMKLESELEMRFGYQVLNCADIFGDNF
jgi:hypothetical protein